MTTVVSLGFEGCPVEGLMPFTAVAVISKFG